MATEEISYAQAMDELAAIVDELEGGSIDLDSLGPRVRRAAMLIQLCRARLKATTDDVEKALADLGAAVEAPAED